ncbi:MAG: dihydrodipicolinate synthase family protein [Planctomycetes bacterium]|nr:dihydrodipicolinate synthase family protein [Planctomycetota bacterium]
MTNALTSAPNKILPALVTPLSPSGRLDLASTERLIDHLYAQGVGGLYVGGGTGEGIYLDAELRRVLVEMAVGMSRGRGQVIVHVGAVEGSLAYDMALHAAGAGADAVASIPPFAGGFSWDEIYGYYRTLCELSPIPVIGYYIPSLTGMPLSIDRLAQLAELPNLAGFKVTDSNLYITERLLSRLRPDQLIYNGPDELLSLGLMLGAHGGIGTTYNFMPKLILQIAALSAAGQHAEAVAVQKQVNRVIEILLTCQFVAATKQILVWQGLLQHAACAAPRASLTAEQQAELRRKLDQSPIADTLVK